MLGGLLRRRVMGIDGSTQAFAYSIYDGKQLVEWGIVEFSGATLAERLVDARRKLLALQHKLRVDIVVMEAAVYVQNKKSVIALAKSYGTIESIVAEGAEFIEVTPTTWYKLIKNNGLSKAEKDQLRKDFPGKSQAWYKQQEREARKRMTQDWIKNTFGVTVVQPDVADAIAIGYYGVEKTSRK